MDRLRERLDGIEMITAEWKLVRDDRDRLEDLLRRKGAFLRNSPRPISVDDSSSVKVLDEILTPRQLDMYQALRAIRRAGGFVRSAGGAAIQALEIGMSETKSPDESLALISRLGDVQILHLESSGVTDEGLARMNDLSDLRRLTLHNTKVTDAGLVHLKGMTKLEWLTLDNTQVTDAGIAKLAGLTSLRTLSLSKSRVTDRALAHLKGMTRLRWLQLRDTQVTDAGLSRLKGLTELEILGLAKTQVTDAGVAELKRTLPNTSIER